MKTYLLIISLLLSTLLHAEIYEIIGKNGLKTYTDKPPLNDTDDKSPALVAPRTGNTWENNDERQASDAYYDELLQQKAQELEEQKAMEESQILEEQQLNDNVENARQALEEAQRVNAGDYYPGKKGLIYTQEYRDRVNNAENTLKEAQEAVEK